MKKFTLIEMIASILIMIVIVSWLTGCSKKENLGETRMFRDPVSERYFSSTLAKVYQVESQMNNWCIDGGDIPVNDYYRLLGMQPILGNNQLTFDCWDRRSFYLDFEKGSNNSFDYYILTPSRRTLERSATRSDSRFR